MLITIDLAYLDNDVEVVGLAQDEALEARLGPRGYMAYRMFAAAARVLFLVLQKTQRPDVVAATEMMLNREAQFVRQRLDELQRRKVDGA